MTASTAVHRLVPTVPDWCVGRSATGSSWPACCSPATCSWWSRRGPGPSASTPTPTGRSNMTDPYTVPAGTFGAFTYTPGHRPAVLASSAVSSWPTFLWLWTAVLVATVDLARLAPGARRARVPAGRPRALPRQRPSADGGRDRARVPLPGRVVVRPADEGDARDRAGLVRRPARVATAGDRPRVHRARRGRVALASIGSCGWTGSTRASSRRQADRRSTSSRSRSRSRCACPRPRSSWPGEEGPAGRGRCPWRRPSPCRSSGRAVSRVLAALWPIAQRRPELEPPHRPRDQVGADRRSHGSLTLRMPGAELAERREPAVAPPEPGDDRDEQRRHVVEAVVPLRIGVLDRGHEVPPELEHEQAQDDQGGRPRSTTTDGATR